MEGGAALLDLGKLHVRILHAAEEIAPIGHQKYFVVIAAYHVDDHKSAWLQLVDNLHAFLAYA